MKVQIYDGKGIEERHKKYYLFEPGQNGWAKAELRFFEDGTFREWVGDLQGTNFFTEEEALDYLNKMQLQLGNIIVEVRKRL